MIDINHNRELFNDFIHIRTETLGLSDINSLLFLNSMRFSLQKKRYWERSWKSGAEAPDFFPHVKVLTGL